MHGPSAVAALGARGAMGPRQDLRGAADPPRGRAGGQRPPRLRAALLKPGAVRGRPGPFRLALVAAVSLGPILLGRNILKHLSKLRMFSFSIPAFWLFLKHLHHFFARSHAK